MLQTPKDFPTETQFNEWLASLDDDYQFVTREKNIYWNCAMAQFLNSRDSSKHHWVGITSYRITKNYGRITHDEHLKAVSLPPWAKDIVNMFERDITAKGLRTKLADYSNNNDF